MRKTVAIVLVLLVALVVWYRMRTPSSDVVSTKPKTLREAYAAPISRTEIQAAAAVSASKIVIDPLEQDCRGQGRASAQFAMADLYEDLRKGRFTLNPKCEKIEGLPEIIRGVYAACTFDAQRVALMNEKQCLEQIAIYRAYWISVLTAGQTDWRQASLSLLSNALIGSYVQSIFDPSKREETIRLAQALVEREPSFIEAHKALVVTKMTTMDQADFNRGAWGEDIQRGLNVDPTDRALLKAYLLNEVLSGRPESIERFIAQNADSALGYYFRAEHSYKQKDYAAAVEDLQTAARLDPSDANVQESLRKLNAGERENVFNVTVGFEFKDL